MSSALDASGTQLATIGTEHTLATLTTNGSYIFWIDLTNLDLGDLIEFRAYTIPLSGGSLKRAWGGFYQHIQAIPMKQFPFIVSDIGASLTLKQISGTGRSFDWKALRL